MPQIAFAKFKVDVPDGWRDITATVDVRNPPLTVAHQDGVGALQFSVAHHRSGPIPEPTPAELQVMVEAFGRKRGLGESSAVVTESGPIRLAAGSFAWGEDFLRVWQVSDGSNFAFVTYTCDATLVGPELEVCEQIVRSIVFVTA